MINYAHRGASEYAPENTLSSFYLGLIQGANGIETDVQRTRDGVPVLFHDDTIDRVSDGHGKISDYTFDQLKKVKIYGNCTTGFYDQIVSLSEFLMRFSDYDIHFAIELKSTGLESDVLQLADQFGIMKKTTYTSFRFEYLQNVKAINPLARVGWLVVHPNDEAVTRLIAAGGEEIAPKADHITPERIQKCRNAGIGIRAWGVSDVTIMKKMCRLGVDGMTVNFPDRLFQFLNGRNEKTIESV